VDDKAVALYDDIIGERPDPPRPAGLLGVSYLAFPLASELEPAATAITLSFHCTWLPSCEQ